MMKKCGVHKLAFVLLVIGGLNWGLVGFFKWDLVQAIFGGWPWLVRVVYALVGLSALAMLGKRWCKPCMGGCKCAPGQTDCKCGGETCPKCGQMPCRCGEQK
jgi:uncharacterized protein